MENVGNTELQNKQTFHTINIAVSVPFKQNEIVFNLPE